MVRDQVLVVVIFIPETGPHDEEGRGTSELGKIRPPRVIESASIQVIPIINSRISAGAVSHYDNLVLERLYFLVDLARTAHVPGAVAVGVGVVLGRIRGICAHGVVAAVADPNSVVGAGAP